MLGLGLRSTQSPGLSISAAPLSAVTEFIGEDFNSDLGNAAINPDPYSAAGTTLLWTELPTGWAQGYNAVIGTSDPVVGTDITSVGSWGSRTVAGTLVNMKPLGFQSAKNATVSSGTGPSGPPTSRIDNSVNLSPASTERYLYTEASSGSNNLGFDDDGDRVFLLRSPGVNFSTQMNDQANTLRLEVQVHGRGSRIGDFEIWIDSADRSNDSSGVKLYTHAASDFTQTSASDAYQKISFSISDIDHPTLGAVDVRTSNNTFYFYLVHIPPPEPGSAFYNADLAIDNFYVEEV